MKRTCAILMLAFIFSGCVEREWTLQTEPAGAIAYVSGVEVGRTPVTIDFTWYGDYEVIFRKAGYETLKTNVKLDPPPYEWVGVDLFSEIAPWTYHDRRETLHLMRKTVKPSDSELIKNAEDLRSETLRDTWEKRSFPNDQDWEESPAETDAGKKFSSDEIKPITEHNP